MPTFTYEQAYLAAGLSPAEAKERAAKLAAAEEVDASESCPCCGGGTMSKCRCRTGHRRCEKGHDWVGCEEHGPVVVRAAEGGAHPSCGDCAKSEAREIVAAALAKAGTSEGADRGWETRRGRMAAGDEPEAMTPGRQAEFHSRAAEFSAQAAAAAAREDGPLADREAEDALAAASNASAHAQAAQAAGDGPTRRELAERAERSAGAAQRHARAAQRAALAGRKRERDAIRARFMQQVAEEQGLLEPHERKDMASRWAAEEFLLKAGTSEGADRGWETRRGRAAVGDDEGEGRAPTSAEEGGRERRVTQAKQLGVRAHMTRTRLGRGGRRQDAKDRETAVRLVGLAQGLASEGAEFSQEQREQLLSALSGAEEAMAAGGGNLATGRALEAAQAVFEPIVSFSDKPEGGAPLDPPEGVSPKMDPNIAMEHAVDVAADAGARLRDYVKYEVGQLSESEFRDLRDRMAHARDEAAGAGHAGARWFDYAVDTLEQGDAETAYSEWESGEQEQRDRAEDQARDAKEAWESAGEASDELEGAESILESLREASGLPRVAALMDRAEAGAAAASEAAERGDVKAARAGLEMARDAASALEDIQTDLSNREHIADMTDFAVGDVDTAARDAEQTAQSLAEKYGKSGGYAHHYADGARKIRTQLGRQAAEMWAKASAAAHSALIDGVISDAEFAGMQAELGEATTAIRDGLRMAEDATGSQSILDATWRTADSVDRVRDGVAVPLAAKSKEHRKLPLTEEERVAEELMGGPGSLEPPEKSASPLGGLVYPSWARPGSSLGGRT